MKEKQMNIYKKLLTIALVTSVAYAMGTVNVNKMTAQQRTESDFAKASTDKYADELWEELEELAALGKPVEALEKCDAILAIPGLEDIYYGYALWTSGMIYVGGQNGVAQNYKKALECLENPIVSRFASELYAHGMQQGLQEEGMLLYYPATLNVCAHMWLHGDATLKADIQKAFNYFVCLMELKFNGLPMEVATQQDVIDLKLASALVEMAFNRIAAKGDCITNDSDIAFIYLFAKKLVKENMSKAELEHALKLVVQQLTK